MTADDGTSDAAFDVWLHRGLHQLYDDVAREPIPDELMRIIEADRARADLGDRSAEPGLNGTAPAAADPPEAGPPDI